MPQDNTNQTAVADPNAPVTMPSDTTKMTPTPTVPVDTTVTMTSTPAATTLVTETPMPEATALPQDVMDATVVPGSASVEEVKVPEVPVASVPQTVN